MSDDLEAHRRAREREAFVNDSIAQLMKLLEGDPERSAHVLEHWNAYRADPDKWDEEIIWEFPLMVVSSLNECFPDAPPATLTEFDEPGSEDAGET